MDEYHGFAELLRIFLITSHVLIAVGNAEAICLSISTNTPASLFERGPTALYDVD